MLQDTAVSSHGSKGGGEASPIIALFIAPARLDQPGQARPPRARRVSDDRPWTGVLTRVEINVPRVDVCETEIGPIASNV